MIRYYSDLTRWEMKQVDRENTIVLIPLGALEQHGNVRQAAEDYAVSNFPFKANWESLCARSAELTGMRQFRSV